MSCGFAKCVQVQVVISRKYYHFELDTQGRMADVMFKQEVHSSDGPLSAITVCRPTSCRRHPTCYLRLQELIRANILFTHTQKDTHIRTHPKRGIEGFSSTGRGAANSGGSWAKATLKNRSTIRSV